MSKYYKFVVFLKLIKLFKNVITFLQEFLIEQLW